MNTVEIVVSVVLSILVMVGISLMSKVRRAKLGNLISAAAILGGIIFTLITEQANGTPIVGVWTIWPALIVGALIGLWMAARVKMIQMPQMVALLNGLGGAASAIVGILSVAKIGVDATAGNDYEVFYRVTGYLAIAVGMITLVGSLVAAGKLHRVLPQKPMVWFQHSLVTMLSLFVAIVFIVVGAVTPTVDSRFVWLVWGVILFSSLFGLYFSVRVGGADMPITISLLNSLSGVAGAIAGMAIGNVLLVAVGGIVGASGLLLTQIMCKAMNRSLLAILSGGSIKGKAKAPVASQSKKSIATSKSTSPKEETSAKEPSLGKILADAKRVIIVPGYGMALAQAQQQVKQLFDTLTANGAEVRFAIHPVAGRMPGHMNVLLAEVNVPYEDLFEMDAVNDDFAQTDLVVVVGANDVLNPAARDAEGTPIYGMPVLNVDQAKHVIICNYDLKPGYAGVENPLYSRQTGVTLCLGDAKETVAKLISELSAAQKPATSQAASPAQSDLSAVLHDAKRVIIVPGYGMALAQAQQQVKQLFDTLTANGAEVRFAIHPVAGRMPGHMNVLLAEVNVPYEDLFEMDAVNDDFAQTDLVVVVGANDVLNPAARDAEGTPIYGMPVLNVDQAKHVIICNYDLKPGYAGVENPLYSRQTGVTLCLGDAKETVAKLITEISAAQKPATAQAASPAQSDLSTVLHDAKRVIIVPGYGMALAQAQQQVKQLFDTLTANGAEVRFAIHPVAGRMPGHMNVLLAEVNVPYEDLFEMDAVNDDFAQTDLVVVVGANDVLNPAARDAEGTPIYGMPVLNVDQAKHVIICNYDLKPGYAGVENPLYSRQTGVTLCLGDAKETVAKLITMAQ